MDMDYITPLCTCSLRYSDHLCEACSGGGNFSYMDYEENVDLKIMMDNPHPSRCSSPCSSESFPIGEYDFGLYCDQWTLHRQVPAGFVPSPHISPQQQVPRQQLQDHDYCSDGTDDSHHSTSSWSPPPLPPSKRQASVPVVFGDERPILVQSPRYLQFRCADGDFVYVSSDHCFGGGGEKGAGENHHVSATNSTKSTTATMPAFVVSAMLCADLPLRTDTQGNICALQGIMAEYHRSLVEGANDLDAKMKSDFAPVGSVADHMKIPDIYDGNAIPVSMANTIYDLEHSVLAIVFNGNYVPYYTVPKEDVANMAQTMGLKRSAQVSDVINAICTMHKAKRVLRNGGAGDDGPQRQRKKKNPLVPRTKRPRSVKPQQRKMVVPTKTKKNAKKTKKTKKTDSTTSIGSAAAGTEEDIVDLGALIDELW